MSIFTRVRDAWNETSPKDRFKLACYLVVDIGTDFLAGYALQKLVPPRERKWKKVFNIAAAGAIGMAAADIANERLGETIDVFWPDDDDEEEANE